MGLRSVRALRNGGTVAGSTAGAAAERDALSDRQTQSLLSLTRAAIARMRPTHTGRDK